MRKVIFKLLIVIMMFVPFMVNAEIKSENLLEALKSEGIETDIDYSEEDKNKVPIYLFRTKGEQKSIDFLNYLNDNYERYGEFFILRSFEVSNNEDNKLLMNNVFDYLRASVQSTPFIVIGNTYFITYDESVNQNIEKSFIELYQSGYKDRLDTIETVKTRYYRNETLMLSIVFTVIFGFICLVVYLILKNRRENKGNN